MNFKMIYILAFFTLTLSGCSNPFGGGSIIEFGSTAALDWDNKDFDFGNQQIGSTSVKTFIISNSGTAEATECGNVTLSDTVNFSIVSQTCLATNLSPGQQCEVVVESRPQTAGEITLNIDRQCRVKSNVVLLTNQVKVTAIGPTAQWAPMTHDFGLISSGVTTFTKVFTFSNAGTSPITNCGLVSLSNPNDFYIAGDTCGVNDLGINNSCEVTVVGLPLSAGIKTSTLNRTCASSFTFSTTMDEIKTEGFDSFLGAYPAKIDFGSMTQGSTTSNYIYLLNQSIDTPVSCTSATISDPTHFYINYDDCGTQTLGLWQSCNLGIQTSSSAPVGEHLSSVTKTCTFADSSVKTVTIPLRVNITPPVPNLQATVSNWNFNDVYIGGYASTLSLDFVNYGGASVTGCNTVSLDNAVDYTIMSDTCSGTDLAPSASCHVNIKPTPQSTGAKPATLSLTCAVGGTVTSALQMNAKANAADLSVSPDTHDFYNVNLGSSAEYTFHFQNLGPQTSAGCSTAVLDNTTDFSIVSDGCLAADIPGNNFCNIRIKAEPASAGVKSATLTRTCTTGGTSVASISATGYVTAPSLSMNPATHSFGNVFVGGSAGQQFAFYNTGSGAATGCSAPTISDTTNFSLSSDTCGTNDMAAGWSSCNVWVSANPKSTGTKTATLSRTCTVGGTISTQTNGITVDGRLSADWIAEIPNQPDHLGIVSVGSASTKKSILFRNANNETLSGCGLTQLSNPTDFTIASDSCGTGAMAANSFCRVEIQGTPQSATADLSTTISRSCTETGSASTSLMVSGSPAATMVKIDGLYTVCALMSDTTVKCWGENYSGSLGDGSYYASTTPVVVRDSSNTILTGVVDISARGYPCALMNTGKVMCWGGSFGYTASEVSGITTATHVAAGSGHACAVLADKTAVCWGQNSYGQLGNGNTGSGNTPIPVTGLTNVVAMTTGSIHTCALLVDTTVKCWGYNTSGELGDGSNGYNPLPVSVGGGLTNVVSISASSSKTCALIGDGSVKCWGDGSYGQMGDGSASWGARRLPVSVSGLSGVRSISSGYLQTCAVLADNTVKCWGGGADPYAYSVNILSPLTITGVSNVDKISTHYNSVCATLLSSEIKCWGSPNALNYGDGIHSTNYNQRAVATLYPNLTNIKSAAIGLSHTCVLSNSGAVSCWGNSNAGQLGDGTTTTLRFDPGPVTALSNVTEIKSSTYSVYALINNGTVYAWGYNNDGQLGDGTTSLRPSPVAVSGLSGAISIEAGLTHACAILTDTTVRCWGSNGKGQLGDGTTTQRLTPVTVVGLTNAKTLALGYEYSCALLHSGGIKCWGVNASGQLGDGTNNDNLSLVDVQGISNASTISASEVHVCSVLTTGAIKCWGDGWYGQLGHGAGGSANTPVVVSEITNAVDVSAQSGYSGHTCAALADGRAQCWGYGSSGEIGDLTYNSAYTPRTVLGLSQITKTFGGEKRSCAVDSSGNLYCWGDNTNRLSGYAPPFFRSPSGL